MKKGIKIVINIISTMILVAVVLLSVFIFISRAQDKMAFVANKSLVWVLTPSMEPEIPAQSYIWVEKVDPSDVKVGDVIVFKSDDPKLNGNMNTHRVIEISEDGKEFTTKGDNNVAADQYTAKADKIVARYVKNLPLLSQYGRFVQKPYGFFTLVLIAVILCAAFTIPDFVNYSKSKKTAAEEEAKEKLMQERIAEEVARLKAEDAKNNKDSLNNDESSSS